MWKTSLCLVNTVLTVVSTCITSDRASYDAGFPSPTLKLASSICSHLCLKGEKKVKENRKSSWILTWCVNPLNTIIMPN